MTRRKRHLKTLDKVLITIAIFLALFIITMIILFAIFQSVPDTLIQYTLGSSALELFFTAWITVSKRKMGIKDD